MGEEAKGALKGSWSRLQKVSLENIFIPPQISGCSLAGACYITYSSKGKSNTSHQAHTERSKEDFSDFLKRSNMPLVDMGNPSLDVSRNTLVGQPDFAEAVSL